MFEAIAVILVTVGAIGYVAAKAIECGAYVKELRKDRAFRNMPTWYLIQTWWFNTMFYTDKLCLIVALPIAVCGLAFLATAY